MNYNDAKNAVEILKGIGFKINKCSFDILNHNINNIKNPLLILDDYNNPEIQEYILKCICDPEFHSIINKYI